MEQLKVKRKDVLVLNLILFLGLSFVFLLLQYAYRYHITPFSITYIKKSLKLFWYASIPILATSFLIWRHHRYSLFFYQFCVALIFFKVMEGLFLEFNKIIVVSLFCYLAIAYFLYQLFKHYLSLASLNPNYSKTDLFDPLLKEIPCELLLNGINYPGYLTNWDENGCFIKLNQRFNKISNDAHVVIHFKERNFEQIGEVVAHSIDFTGVGIKFESAPKGLNVFNWDEFNELVHELGYKPERLR